MGRLIFCACLLMISACNVVEDPYAYTPLIPNEQPATITSYHQTLSSHETAMFTDEAMEAISVGLVKIDDKYVRTGAEIFGNTADNRVLTLSPARHVLVLQVNVGTANKASELVLNALPGERYTLMSGYSGNPVDYVAKNTNMYQVWVQDSQGRAAAQLPPMAVKKRFGG